MNDLTGPAGYTSAKIGFRFNNENGLDPFFGQGSCSRKPNNPSADDDNSVIGCHVILPVLKMRDQSGQKQNAGSHQHGSAAGHGYQFGPLPPPTLSVDPL